MGSNLLNIVLALPALGALVLAVLPSRQEELYKKWSLGVMVAGFLASLGLWTGFDPQQTGMQFASHREWVPAWGFNWDVGVDGLSLLLVMLTTFLGPIVVLGAWTSVDKRHKEFFAHILLLQSAMIGAFVATNLFVFYLFWELMLIPMFFLIGIWGGDNRIYATVKFFLYTLVGSMLMLVAIVWLYGAIHDRTGTWSLLFSDLTLLTLSKEVQLWLFAAFAISFAIKVPMFPVHTWLPDAHVQAPTAGSVILAGVLLKMGTYGFLRLAMPVFPDAVFAARPLIMTLSVVGIGYGALVAMVQPDIKKLVAYSSVSHLGYCMLGLFAVNLQGAVGAILQMINHGISTGALFLLVGVLYERTHSRRIYDYGGLAGIMPIYTVLFVIVTMSSIGLPGTNGFVGEFLVLTGAFLDGFGTWKSTGNLWSFSYAATASLGLIFGAVYMLWMVQRVFFGKPNLSRHAHLQDVNFRELVVFAPLLLAIFWIGVQPSFLTSRIEPSVQAWLLQVERGRGEAEARAVVMNPPHSSPDSSPTAPPSSAGHP